MTPIILLGQLQMKRITFLDYGLKATYDGGIVCSDINYDGINELIFAMHNDPDPNLPMQWQVWQCQPINRYELVFVDTGWPRPGPPPLGIKTGNLYPFACGLLDQDSCFDLVGMNAENLSPNILFRPLSTVQEGPSQFSYPVNLVWFDRLPGYFNVYTNYIIDLDQDGRNEILFRWYNETYDQGTRIYENTGDNQYQLVFNQPPVSWHTYAFGDFDQDGRKDFAFPGGSKVYIRECTGNNQYPLVCSLPNPIVGGNPLSNPHDCWDGRDVDNDGRPEFFIAYQNAMQNIYYLYMGEAINNNNYELTFIDQVQTYQNARRRSACGDIDGDGTEEIVWSVGRWVLIYKSTGNNQFQRVLTLSGHGGETPAAIVTIYDMNKNGYNEIIYGGNGYTSIYEVEAVRLLRPNGGEVFQDSTQELIRWQKFYPPRCDSLSLFYSTDNGSTFLPLASNISSSDTSFLWTVPSVNSDSCKIKIIAYGPGWQYDESDGNFSITSLGVSEIATLPLAMTLSVKVFPNPTKSLTAVRYSLPAEGKISLQLYDISGRLVKTLVDEYKKPGNYSITLNSRTLSAGVYFLSLETKEKRIIERIVIIK
jgi:hypothetical protein